MRLALVEPYVSNASLKSYADRTEPAHLVGMFGEAVCAGVQADIIDAYSARLSAVALADRLNSGGFTHAGFTTYTYEPCLEYLKELRSSLNPAIVTIAGGPGGTYLPELIATTLQPDWLVQDDGEPAIRALIAHDWKDLDHDLIGETRVLRAPLSKLDTYSFRRPYSLQPYGFEASPRLQRGCKGSCVFCAGAFQRDFDCLSKHVFAAMLEHLFAELGMQILSPAGPDFTAMPAQANQLIEALLESGYHLRSFRPGVRLDTLTRAVRLDPDLWTRLSHWTDVRLESSIESFAPARLARLGKNVSPAYLDAIGDRIAEILAACPSHMVLGRIALDPTVTIEEFVEDCRLLIALLERFPDQVTVGGMLMNRFVPVAGTASGVGGDNPWKADSFADPRMRVLSEDLLEVPRFLWWCRLAQQNQDYRERNEIFCEILRVSAERAGFAASAAA